jgi:hypothetical protein
MLRDERGLSGDLISRSSGWQSDGCSRTVRSSGSCNFSSGESGFLRKRNQKVRRRMNTAADCEALGTFYRVKEGGGTVSWRRNV